MPKEKLQPKSTDDVLQGYTPDPMRLKIFRIFEYEGFFILIQGVGVLFQALIFKDGVWRQNYFTDSDDKKEYKAHEIVRVITYLSDMAKATVDVVRGVVVKDKKALEIAAVLEELSEDQDAK